MWVKGCAFAFSCSGAGSLTVDLFAVAAAVLLSLVISLLFFFFFFKSLWKVTLALLSEMRVGDGYLYYFFFFLGVNTSLIIPTRGEPG